MFTQKTRNAATAVRPRSTDTSLRTGSVAWTAESSSPTEREPPPAPSLLCTGARLGRPMLLAGVVAGPDERPCFDPREPQRFAGGLPFGELLGRHVARHGDLQRARPQVLADREQVTPGISEVLHGLHDFAGLLPHAD